jgi:hypothetical protein
MALKPKHIPHAFRQDPDALPRKPNLQKLCLLPKAFLSPSFSSVWENNRGDDVDELAWRDHGRRAQTDQTMPTAWLSITVSIAVVVALLLLALVLVVVHHLSVPLFFSVLQRMWKLESSVGTCLGFWCGSVVAGYKRAAEGRVRFRKFISAQVQTQAHRETERDLCCAIAGRCFCFLQEKP